MPPKFRVSKPLFLENQTDKRRDRAQELRSARRQGVLAKRRKFALATSTTAAAAAAATPAAAAAAGGGASGKQHQEAWSREALSEAVRGVKECPVSQVLPYLVELRKLLSLEDPPVEEVVEGAGLSPRLIELLSAPNDEIQTETTWSVLQSSCAGCVVAICHCSCLLHPRQVERRRLQTQQQCLLQYTAKQRRTLCAVSSTAVIYH